MNWILSGFMGSGKSTVARALADMTGRRMIDLDCYIEEQNHMTISELFSLFGESRFRALEQQAVNEVAQMENAIIATGGGTLINQNNAAVLKQNGVIFFLDITVDTVLRRLKDDTTRPLLQRPNKKDAVTELLCGRLPIYTATADYIIDGNVDDASAVAKQILERTEIL